MNSTTLEEIKQRLAKDPTVCMNYADPQTIQDQYDIGIGSGNPFMVFSLEDRSEGEYELCGYYFLADGSPTTKDVWKGLMEKDGKVELPEKLW